MILKNQNIQNIIECYNVANDWQRESGAAWYQNALVECEKLAIEYDRPTEHVVKATAALSQRLRWERNIPATESALNGEKLGGVLWTAFEKAIHILDGEYRYLSGDKVTRFADNILGDTDRVTIDVWAVRIWKNDGYKLKVKSFDYDEIEADYQAAAATLDIDPRELQAVTWLTYRTLARNKGQLTLL